jgi:DNA-3-methyladenine glycosylase II
VKTINAAIRSQAAAQLSEHDPHLRPVIAQAGLTDMAPHHEYYRALANSIIGQQLSVKAAATIKQRFVDLFGGTFPTPEAILARPAEELRSAGLSGQKAAYIRDLAQHVVDGKVRFDHLDEQTNREIIDELTDIKGIGEWTVHMFLMFSVGRPDVLAVGDLGVRTGIKKLYNLTDLPTPAEVQAIAQQYHWHPYESIACWYVWRSLDNAPA